MRQEKSSGILPAMSKDESRRARGRLRMGQAISRGVAAYSADGKPRALRWVARWSVVAGIQDIEIFTLRQNRK